MVHTDRALRVCSVRVAFLGCGDFPQSGYHFGGPYHKDYGALIILGSVLGSPSLETIM